MIRNTLTSYGVVAKFFHWAIAALIIFMLIAGYFLNDFPQAYRGEVYNLHKLTGILILFLMLLRMCWALLNPKPMLPVSIPKSQRFLAWMVHYCLYIAAIGMPLAGWAGASAAGRYPHIGEVIFMLPVSQHPETVKIAFALHGYFAFALITLISVHVLAAFYHHFVKHDLILKRILPVK